MKQIARLIWTADLTVILLACDVFTANGQVESKRIRTEQIVQFFRDVKVEDIQEHSVIVSFTTVAPASVHVQIESLDKTPLEEKIRRGTYLPDEDTGVRVEDKTVEHQVKLRWLRGLSPGTTRNFSIKATAEDGRTYEYSDKFIVPQPTTLPAETRPLGTVAKLFFQKLNITASDDSVTFSFSTTEPASLRIVTRNRPIPEEKPEGPPVIATTPKQIPDFGFPDLSGVGEVQVGEKRDEHSISFKPIGRFLTGRTYYYLIVATTREGRIHRYGGTFQARVDREPSTTPAATKRRRIP